MGFFKWLANWVIAWFSAKSAEQKKLSSELKKLIKHLSSLHPSYYKCKTRQLMPGFVKAFYRFYILLRPLQLLCYSTVLHYDPKLAQRHIDNIIDQMLPEEDRIRKRDTTYEEMVKRLDDSKDASFKLVDISNEFQTLLRSIKNLGDNKVNSILYSMHRFMELCQFDFERLIKMSDPRISTEELPLFIEGHETGRSRYKADFTMIDAEQALPELLDFYYSIESFRFNTSLKDSISIIAERRFLSTFDVGKQQKLDKIFNKLDKILADDLNEDTILALIRVIKMQSTFKPHTSRNDVDYFRDYVARLTTQFELDCQKILQEKNQDAIANAIHALFGDLSLLSVNGYDLETNSILESLKVTGYNLILPVQAIKTFTVHIFEPEIKDAIKQLLIEGYFENRIFQSDLADAIYRCEQLDATIAEFENQLGGKSRFSVRTMKRYVEDLSRRNEAYSFLANYIEVVNSNALKLVEDYAQAMSILYDCLRIVLEDTMRIKPVYIANIKILASVRSRDIVSKIEKAKGKVTELLQFLSNFITVSGFGIKSGLYTDPFVTEITEVAEDRGA